MFWTAIFGQHLLFAGRWDIYEEQHTEMDAAAMFYTCLCLLGFWLGFALPVGRWLSKIFSTLPSGLYVNPNKLRKQGMYLLAIAFIIQIVVNGPAVFYSPGGGLATRGMLMVGPTIGRYLSIIVDILGIIGAVMVGYSWPAKGERNFASVGLGVVALMMAANVFMSRFSRASGMPFLLAYGAASVRFRKVNIFFGLLIFYLVATCALTALTGRAVYGHYAGSFFFFKHFFTYSLTVPLDSLEAGMQAGDSLTPLTVTMLGVETTDIHELTPLQWIANLTPVPRSFGLPEWTTDPSRSLGTMYLTHPFWYTLGLFGDTYAHFRYWGFIWFIPIGIGYRMVHQLASWGLDRASSVNTGLIQVYQFINLYTLLLVMTYSAMLRGLFNTYRSFEVSFLMVVGLLTGFLFLVKLYRGPGI